MNPNEPFGLPRGTVRAIITIVLLVILCLTLFIPTVPAAKEILSGLLALAVVAVRDYFATRASQNVSDGPSLPPPSVN